MDKPLPLNVKPGAGDVTGVCYNRQPANLWNVIPVSVLPFQDLVPVYF